MSDDGPEEETVMEDERKMGSISSEAEEPEEPQVVIESVELPSTIESFSAQTEQMLAELKDSAGDPTAHVRMLATCIRQADDLPTAEHAERPFFAALVAFVSGGQVLKMELSGDDAIAKWRALIGPTDSNKAREEAPDSVRAKFGTDNQRNAAHGSDSTESAARELAMMFA